MKHNHICGEKQIAVELLRAELIHDIEFETWKISKTRIDNPTIQEHMQADFEAQDWIERQIEQAIDDIYGELSFCLVDNARAVRDALQVSPAFTENNFPYEDMDDPDDLVKMPHHYTFLFIMEPEWNGKARSLKTDLHRYIVYTVLARWFELVKTDEVAGYQTKATEAIAQLRNDARPDTCNVTFIL